MLALRQISSHIDIEQENRRQHLSDQEGLRRPRNHLKAECTSRAFRERQIQRRVQVQQALRRPSNTGLEFGNEDSVHEIFTQL
jgi:hypothetical protein